MGNQKETTAATTGTTTTATRVTAATSTAAATTTMKWGLKPFLALNEGILFAVVGRRLSASPLLRLRFHLHLRLHLLLFLSPIFSHTHTHTDRRRQDFVRTIKCDLSCLSCVSRCATNK